MIGASCSGFIGGTPYQILPSITSLLTLDPGIIAATAQNMNALIGANVLLGLSAGVQYVEIDTLHGSPYSDEDETVPVMA